MPASPVRPEGQGDQVPGAENTEGVVRLPNGVHTNNAVASSSKVEAVDSEPASAVALGKRKWRESDIVAESSREIDLSLQLDYLATQYPEQRIPPPNLHPPGFVHYDVPIGDSWNTARETRSPSKTRIKLEEGEAVQPPKDEVKPEPVAEGPPPFRDAEDVVERLLPWHVWQIWDDDLDYQPLSEAACKAAEAVPQEQEKRLVDVLKRFKAVREREAKHASNVPSLLQLHPNLAQILRAEIAPLQHQLRAARHELDTINRTKREQEERQRRIKEETERRERDVRRVEELKKGHATSSSSQVASRPNSGPSTPAATAGTTADGKPQPPVVVNLSMSHLPQAIKIGLLALPGTAPVGVKPPATVVRTVDEQKVTVTIDLARCSQAHIAFLAKCLNIQPIAPGAAASSSSTPAKSPANSSSAKPSPK